MRSWLNTFREPERSAVAILGNRLFEVSLRNAEALKASIHAKEDKDHTQRWFMVVCEFLYFFMHLTNRFAYGELGHEQRCKVQDQLYPLMVRPTIESIFGHWPPNLKDGMEKDLTEKLNDAEIEYGECKQLVDDNPFSRDALFSKFAGNVCELLGVERDNPAAYAATFMKVVDLALGSFKELNFPEAVRAIGKEL